MPGRQVVIQSGFVSLVPNPTPGGPHLIDCPQTLTKHMRSHHPTQQVKKFLSASCHSHIVRATFLGTHHKFAKNISKLCPLNVFMSFVKFYE